VVQPCHYGRGTFFQLTPPLQGGAAWIEQTLLDFQAPITDLVDYLPGVTGFLRCDYLPCRILLGRTPPQGASRRRKLTGAVRPPEGMCHDHAQESPSLSRSTCIEAPPKDALGSLVAAQEERLRSLQVGGALHLEFPDPPCRRARAD
jgi:hypothetical protein